MKKLTIGVTGGIASGKSTVARAFEAHGIPWVDADDVAREIVAPGEPALDEIVARHGQAMLDAEGQLNRRALRELVFREADERAWLESVMHPRIRQRILAYLERMRESQAPYHLLVSPLLFESGQFRLVDRTLVIDIPESVQITRTAARDDVNEAQAQAIVDAQMPRHERLACADDVIDNSGEAKSLAEQVATLDRKYRALCASS